MAPKASGSTSAQYVEAFSSIDPESFDWTSFESSYKGRALITRLLHAPTVILQSKTIPSDPSHPALVLARQALIRAIHLIKTYTWDWQTYVRACFLLRRSLDPTGAHPVAEGADETWEGQPGVLNEREGWPDTEWVNQTRDMAKKEDGRLDVELRGYMSNLIKESIRLTWLAFAELSIKTGNAQNAARWYDRSKEYSTGQQHHLDAGLGLLDLAMSFNQLSTLPGNISKVEATLDRLHPPPGPSSAVPQDARTTAGDVREGREREARAAAVRKSIGIRLRVARGLVALADRDFARAGRELGDLCENGMLGDWRGVCISSDDVALISVLCILATGTRDRIRAKLVDRPVFRATLNDSGNWILPLVNSFLGARYDQVSSILKSKEAYILLNPFLSPHCETLFASIQRDSMVQYVLPYSSVQIATMAQAFEMDQNAMIAALETLIVDGSIRGKINLIDGILELKAPDQRAQLFLKVLETGQKTSQITQAAHFRLLLHESGITVDPRPKENHGYAMGPSDGLELDKVVDNASGSTKEGEVIEMA
ncbi:putative cop9 signalosome complex subunit 1 [Naematelia encephala]|uniref:Putative cop9 signalosome complex subunit 1 n=1 Tax=Naematelia encephala TaxID=71784 RepID=A0A1Y2BK98_9TREE|nr:putative cop9 signalosome complex subunit 1 [Naematelia encephala]